MEGKENNPIQDNKSEKPESNGSVDAKKFVYGVKKKNDFEFNPETPFGTVEINAFKPAGGMKEETFSVFSGNAKKCPGCGSNLRYNVEAGQLICNSCGNVYDADSMNMVGSLSIGNPEVDYETEDDIDYDDRSLSEVVCNSCGSQIVTDANTASTMCPFCGSPMLVMRKLTRQFKPDAILPFEFNKDEAVKKFTEYVKGVPHVPAAFKSQNVIKKIQGVYVPFWIISADVHMDIGGNAFYIIDGSPCFDRVKQEEVGNHAMCAPVDGVIDFGLKNVPFDGSKKISNRLMEAVEPFDLSKLVPFSTSYLHGYSAEKYDSQPKDMYDNIRKRLDVYSHEVAEKVQFEDCDFFEYNSAYTMIKYSNYKIIYCLLPIWFLNVKYEDRNYQFAINGESGEVCGAIPYSRFWETIYDLRTKMQSSSLIILRSIREMVAIGCASGLTLLYVAFRFWTEFRGSLGKSLAVIMICIALLLMAGGTVLPALMASAEKNARNKVKGAKNPHVLDKRPDVSYYYDTTQRIIAKKKLVAGGAAGISMGKKLIDAATDVYDKQYNFSANNQNLWR